MSWITTIPFTEATGRLKSLYQRIKGPDDNVDNVMLVHSLRPHTMEGHMALYKNVLHHTANSSPKWRLELLGVWVSLLNGCAYCVEHHVSGLGRELGDEGKASNMRAALEKEDFSFFDDGEKALLAYAFKLTTEPAGMVEQDVAALAAAGFTDGEILETNQIVAYFAYANRTVLGLGVDHEGDVLGLSPKNSADPGDWRHG
ncbi:MAG: carboxymuconolactone decarboxylase family protein [Sphingomonadales bacterium]